MLGTTKRSWTGVWTQLSLRVLIGALGGALVGGFIVAPLPTILHPFFTIPPFLALLLSFMYAWGFCAVLGACTGLLSAVGSLMLPHTSITTALRPTIRTRAQVTLGYLALGVLVFTLICLGLLLLGDLQAGSPIGQDARLILGYYMFYVFFAMIGLIVFTGATFGLGERVQLVEVVTWSWPRFARRFGVNLALLAVEVLVLAFLPPRLLNDLLGAYGNTSTAVSFYAPLLVFGTFMIGSIFIGNALLGGVDHGQLGKEKRYQPNQGIHDTVRFSLAFGATYLVAGITASLAIGFAIGSLAPLIAHHPVIVTSGSELGYRIAITVFVITTLGYLLNGGGASIKHLLLRLLLSRRGETPWNYASFLDYCTEHILLRKVGGGYIFVHRYLLEHIAGIYPPPSAASSATPEPARDP